MLQRIPNPALLIPLMITLAVPPTINSEASQPIFGAKSRAATVHVDCLDHGRPQLCTRVVEELIAELGRFNAAFNPPDLDRLAAFYHQDAVVFSGGRFFVGRHEIQNELLTPLVANITGATVDISAFRFQVITPNLVIAYGSPSTVITLPGPPLKQSHTWISQSKGGERRFVLLTDHNGGSESVSTNTGSSALTSLVQAKAGAGEVHPDCASHSQPRLCNHVVEELMTELDLFNDAFASGDADELAAFFHEDAILFVDSVGRFFRGRNEIRNDFFVPLIDSILNATVDTSSRIIFSSDRGDGSTIYQRLSNGTGKDEVVAKFYAPAGPHDWSPDGKLILLSAISDLGSTDLWVMPLFGEQKPAPLVQTEFSERQARLSPDGKWIAYASNASGTYQVYVESFPTSGGKWQVSAAGGAQPQWRAIVKSSFTLPPIES